MDSDDGNADDRSALAPATLTTRLDGVETGDELRLNDRDQAFEVVETSRYAIRVIDPSGNDYTISQNLQTGGWQIHEDVWWVAADPEDGGQSGADSKSNG
ncbi:MAG: transcriptional regulator [Haloplanus sp.]